MTDIPKQDLLAKLLKMTSSSNDGEALVAIRKANELLRSAGWDWDKLIQGKIKVAADPFANLQTPYNPGTNTAPPPPPRRQPTTPPPFTTRPAPPPGMGGGGGTYNKPNPPPPPPKPAAPPKPFEPYSHRSTNGQSNAFPGNCYCCGFSVSAKAGKLFVPSQFNSRAPSSKKVICDTCDQNRNTYIDSRPAPQPKTQPFTGPAPRASDL